MAAPVLQIKRGLLVDLPGLRGGEPGFTTDSYDLYVGIDNTTPNNKFFGSHRYWTRENGSRSLGLNLIDKNGSNYITIKSPDDLSVSGIGTYILPDTNTIVDNYFLKVSTSGQLSWDSIFSNTTFSNSTLSGITTISGSLINQASTVNSGITTFSNTTDNTLGNADTGAVQIDGGLGINKNLTVGANLNVQGHSEFVGVVTFRGGTINIGDSNTDNINIGGEFISNLVANDDATYDIGIGTQRWRNAEFSGAVNVGTALSAPTIKTATVQHSNGTGAATIDASGNITAAQNLTVTGNLYVSGNTTQVNTTALTVEDRTIDLGIVNGAAPAGATTWDLGVLFNYFSGTAKKSAVIWEQGDTRFKFASVLNEDTTALNVENNPQLTVTTFAPIEISQLWVTDCAGTSQVINCSGTTRTLENITIDAGTF